MFFLPAELLCVRACMCVGGGLEVCNYKLPQRFCIEKYKPWKMYVTKCKIGDIKFNKNLMGISKLKDEVFDTIHNLLACNTVHNTY